MKLFQKACIYLVNYCRLDDVSSMTNSGLARLELIIFITRPEPEFDGSYPTLWRHYPIGPIPEKFRLVLALRRAFR